MKDYLFLLLFLFTCFSGQYCSAQTPTDGSTFEGYELASKGAWCWFADPRALHYESKDGSINKTYIGYIDIHGNIKAMQIDRKTHTKEEVLVRSYFQPDDHNNPTFLVLPDERVMIFYSRHTDEACFYYRISREPGDVTTLGEEKIITTDNKTTYPSPFILSDDPKHIYLCWRGINWHPTIGRLLIPDKNDDTNFDWGPYQMVQSTGARPYAKYTSNGKDKIYATYTTGHPDNEQSNYVYLNYIDINALNLKDIDGEVLTTIQEGPHQVNKTTAYVTAYPNAVVEHTNERNWIWEVALDAIGNPVIAMVRISSDKTQHDYYHVRWNGKEWKKTFLMNAGGHFHQTPDTERCYSGGMTLNKQRPEIVYCSVPVKGSYGMIYEIVKCTVTENGRVVKETITKNSKKNNSRPYYISGAGNDPLFLGWMYGDYYDWIVSAKRPLGYCTGIHSITPLPIAKIDLASGLVKQGKLVASQKEKLIQPLINEITLSMMLDNGGSLFKGKILNFGGVSYGIDSRTLKPFVVAGNSVYKSSNVLGNSDTWQKNERTTNGKWLKPKIPNSFHLCITYVDGVLRTYINGLLDQTIHVEEIYVDEIELDNIKGASAKFLLYDRKLSQEEIKQIDKKGSQIEAERQYWCN